MINSFKSLTAALVVAALTATAASASPDPHRSRACFASHTWQGWSASADGDALYLRAGPHEIFQVDLAPGAHVHKDGGHFLVARVRGSGWICSALDLDLTLSDQQGFQQPLLPRALRQLTPAEVMAIPRKDLPS